MQKTAKLISFILALSGATAFAAEQTATSTTTTTAVPAAAHGQTTPQADNTNINARDKNDAAPTPDEQSGTEADRKLLASVRSAVVDDKKLSVAAHNVKILAAQGVITLRGPVKSTKEKAKVEAIVKKVPGVTSVNNQLDVKTN
ncbi:MAG: BON domain-containing protein [Pseudomonadota bacterium]